MMQAVGILSVCVEVVDRGTERWTVSRDCSEEGKGEDDVELCQRKGGLTSCPQHDGHLVNLAPSTSYVMLPL